MEYVRAFTNFPGLAEMQTFIASKDASMPFETSELYSSEKDAKIVNHDLRKSRFRTFQDKRIFELVDQVIQWLNESDENYSYQLRRDNITETRYEEGGVFIKHKDYLSVTSNVLEEFTLLLCVTPDTVLKAVGGETLIFFYGSKKGTPFDTTKAGSGLLFRKDLDHAGSLLKAGEKHILTANLWATRKQVSNQVLFVTFPEAPKEASTAAPPQAELKRVANQDTSYALPVSCLKGTMLDAHVRFVNQTYKAQDLDEPTVVTYECTDFGFEEFGTVYKILLRTHVDETCIRNHEACIDFFGPFLNENLLINLALENKPDTEASCDQFVKPANIKGPYKKKAKTAAKPKSEEPENLNVIVCENESRTKVVYEVAQKLGLGDYVPFKMIFVSGVIAMGYYDSFETVDVTPVVLVVGDYNHVFGIQKFENIKARTLKELHEKHAFDVEASRLFDNDDDEDDDSYFYDNSKFQENMDFCGGAHGMGLKIAMGEGDMREGLTKYISNCSMADGEYLVARDYFSPMSNFTTEPNENEKAPAQEINDMGTPKLFHRDENGKATFTEAEAAAASAFLAAMNIDGRVKASLQEKRFELPQETEEYDQYYCNESTYANFDVLFVTGLVKLDSSIDKSFTGHRFDAWPTAQQQEERSGNIRQHFANMGIPMPRGLDGDY